MTPLQTAAQAVIARWESPKWKDEAPTAVVIGALLKALTDEQAQAVKPVATVQCVRGVTIGYLDVMQPVGTKLYLHPATPPEPTVKQSLMVHASAEDYMRYKYGAYRGHFAWRELEEAYSQGRYDELQAQGPIPWPDDAPEEVRYKRGYAVALSDAEEAIDDECRERVVTASDCIEIIRNLGAETEATADDADLIVAKLNALSEAQQVAVLTDIEQYRMQMAGISTAALGYWSEGDDIHPDYDTPALRDVARLYVKYDQLSQEKKARRSQQGHDLPLDLLERLSKTLINLGYSTPEGGMEHFGARIESQLYNLCRGIDSILAQQVAVPDGWALVPIEPTEEMIVALMCTGLRHAEYRHGCDPTIAHMAQGYTAMLAAAQGAKLVTQQVAVLEKREPLNRVDILNMHALRCWPRTMFADKSYGIALDTVTVVDFVRIIEAHHGIGAKP